MRGMQYFSFLLSFLGFSEAKGDYEPLLSCSPSPMAGPSPNCPVSCDLRWESGDTDQWVCRDDYLKWMVSFSLFLISHALGTV
jgi:hypothetical protein